MTTHNTLADLLLPAQVSRSLLDAALRANAPEAWARCCAPGAAVGPPALREGVRLALPEALNVGWHECLRHRWWPAAQGPAGQPQTISFSLWPRLEGGHASLAGEAFSITLRVSVELQPTDASALVDAAAARALLVNARPWVATLRLYVADGLPADGALCFYTARQNVVLPALLLPTIAR